MRFLIGRERATCHVSKQSNSLGRAKVVNSLGKQQLELSTRTYGGPQVSRQKFQVNTAQLKKIRQQLL